MSGLSLLLLLARSVLNFGKVKTFFLKRTFKFHISVASVLSFCHPRAMQMFGKYFQDFIMSTFEYLWEFNCLFLQ